MLGHGRTIALSILLVVILPAACSTQEILRPRALSWSALRSTARYPKSLQEKPGSRLYFENGNSACPVGSEPILDVTGCIEGADETLDLRSICGHISLRACIRVVERPELPRGCLTLVEGVSAELLLNPSGTAEGCVLSTCNVVCVKGSPTSPPRSTITATTTRTSTLTMAPTHTTAATLFLTTYTSTSTPVTTPDYVAPTATLAPTSAEAEPQADTPTLTNNNNNNNNNNNHNNNSSTTLALALETSGPALTTSAAAAEATTTTATTTTADTTTTTTTAATTTTTSTEPKLTPSPSTSSNSQPTPSPAPENATATTTEDFTGCGQVCHNWGFMPTDCRCESAKNWHKWICTSKGGHSLKDPHFCDQFCNSCQP
ncbi:unnamed protein product [Polarella glacialis]|uniref:Uncharacterized protein n=1 Tax=Polarella glacialis TaxID=89957 RepID=A0A813EKK3_POLGL|nr:unnamed protein product [Polarella glacialis]